MKKIKLISLISVCFVIVLAAVYYGDCGHRGFCLTHKCMLYDHIRYDGNEYYPIDTLIDIDRKSDFTAECQVQLIDSDEKTHGKELYTAYLLPSDSEKIYLYFQNCFYTKDIFEAGSWYGLCE